MTLKQKINSQEIQRMVEGYRPKTLRQPEETVGIAVTRRTVFRQEDKEDWANVAKRVAIGNSSLHPTGSKDAKALMDAIGSMAFLTSGRHLQHGDAEQHKKNMELFSNCSTANTCATSYYLLLNGSGVGRSYDNELLAVDWSYAPDIECALSTRHPDYKDIELEKIQSRNYDSLLPVFDSGNENMGIDASFKKEYGNDETKFFIVPDNRAGLAKALVFLETITYQNTLQKKREVKKVYIDFSLVREKGKPIKGMQGRPSNGPDGLIKAFSRINTMSENARSVGTKKWLQNMLVDHYMADSVVVGGSRRSSRIAVMHWKSEDISSFIRVKRELEMWSANNSVGLDAEFYELLHSGDAATHGGPHPSFIMDEILKAQYNDRTGEPGYLNLHKLSTNDKGMKEIADNPQFGNMEFGLHQPGQKEFYSDVLQRCYNHIYHFIVNPCGEIALSIMGGFCVIGDIALYFCESLKEALEVAKLAVRFLIRTNLMPSVYGAEVKRTNRIGVGLTGMFEFAWKFFKLAPDDLLQENEKSMDFWRFISKLKRVIDEEAKRYSEEIGVACPHTNTCFKPSGTVSKIPLISEGAHLPSMVRYLRWVQFQHGSPLIKEHKEAGYPVKENLETYKNTSIVGFPVEPEICKIGMPEDRISVATDWSLPQHFKWLQLLEKYYIRGVDENGKPNTKDTGNQVSYTAKYSPDKLSFDELRDYALSNWESVKCATVMPVMDVTAYEYQPEQPIGREEFDKITAGILEKKEQTITLDELQCASGACPI